MSNNSNSEMLLSEEIKSLLDSVKIKDRDKKEYIDALYALMCAYESEDNSEKASEVARDLIDKCGNDNVTEKMLRTSYDVLARGGDFEAYCIALEWNRPLNKKFYIPRARLLKKHGVMQSLQDLSDDKLDLLVLNMPPRVGKNHSNSTPVLTRQGWKRHGDLQIGDYVLNEKGDFVKVLAVSEEYPTEYKITMSNGETFYTHGNHDWVIYDISGKKNKILSTQYMYDRKLQDCNGHSRFLLPDIEPIKGDFGFLPVEPYVLGAWIGDGSTSNPYITENINDSVIISTIENKGYRVNKKRQYKESCAVYEFDGLKESLNCIGLCYRNRPCEKYIPQQYLVASIEQRLELLAGLIDTDGTLDKKSGRYYFKTTIPSIKDSVVSLISSFGWRASVSIKEPNETTETYIHSKKTQYEIGFNPTFAIPCRVERKKLTTFKQKRRISVKSIEKIDNGEPGKCIQVEGGIYLVGHQLVPTHNSTISLFFLTFRAGLYPEKSILGNGHSTALTQSFYKEFLEIVTSDEYRYKEIFPRISITTKNSEYSYVDFNDDKRFHTAMFRSVEGGTTGLVEASNLLYCDDLVKDVETANSKDRLDKLYYSYTSTIKDRKVPRLCKDGKYRPCPELHVNTPWSIYDVTSRIVRTEMEKGNNDRMRVVSVPCWDDNHESNFMYDYGKGFDVDYYEDMQLAEDPVIFSAKYLMKPIERDGHPFERDALTYYTELPNETPDAIVAYNDVAHGGEDFMSMPIGYVYGRDVYIEDVLFIHNFDGDTVSRPLVCEKIISNNVSRCGFEKNNGGDFYSTLISEDLRKMGYRCNIMSYNAPTTKSKLDRILSCQNEIKGVASLDGSYRVYFKDPKLVSKNSDYMAFLTNMWSWSQKEGSIQKKQHDDSVDSISSLIINLLGKGSDSAKLKLYDIRKAGY